MSYFIKKYFWIASLLFILGFSPKLFAASNGPLNCDTTTLGLNAASSVIFSCYVSDGVNSYYGNVICDGVLKPLQSVGGIYSDVACSFSTVGSHTIAVSVRKTLIGNPPSTTYSLPVQVQLCTPNTTKEGCTVTGPNVNSACTAGYQVCKLDEKGEMGWDPTCNAITIVSKPCSGDNCPLIFNPVSCIPTTNNPCEGAPFVCQQDGSCKGDPVTDIGPSSCEDGNWCNGIQWCQRGACVTNSLLQNPALFPASAFNDYVAATNSSEMKNRASQVGVPDACSGGQGICQKSGTYECSMSQTTSKQPLSKLVIACNAQPDAAKIGAEICNGLDDDCDGIADNNLNDARLNQSCNPGSSGECKEAYTICKNGTVACDGQRTAPNNTPCNDGDLCTNSSSCQSGVCIGSNPKSCPVSDQCHDAGVCNKATGLCDNPAKPDNTLCSDGNACTQNDACQKGKCIGGAPVACTPDACHEAGICNATNGTCTTGIEKPKPFVDGCHEINPQCGASGWVVAEKEKPKTDACHEIASVCGSGGWQVVEKGGKPVPKTGCQAIVCGSQGWELEDIPGKPRGDACHESVCGPQGWMLQDKQPKLSPSNVCHEIICGTKGWEEVVSKNKPKEDACHVIECHAEGWVSIEKPDCNKKAVILPAVSLASSKIFEVGKREGEPDSGNKTCTVLLNSFSSAGGATVVHPGEFDKQFLIITGEDANGAGKLAYVPPKSMGELGDNCKDLGSKIQYRDLGRILKMPAIVPVNGKNALIGVADDNVYLFYDDVESHLQTDLGMPIIFNSGPGDGDRRFWNSPNQRECRITKIDHFKIFSHGDIFYALGGVECGVVATDPPTPNDPAMIVGLDLCSKKAADPLFNCDFVPLQQLSDRQKVEAIRIEDSSKQEGKFYAIVATKEGTVPTTKLIEVNKAGASWTTATQNLYGMPSVIVGKDKVKRDQPASADTGNKIFITDSEKVIEMKEETSQARLEDHGETLGANGLPVVHIPSEERAPRPDSGQIVDARFEPNDNFWNVYEEEPCGLNGGRVTLDEATNNPKVALLDKEHLTADSEENNILNNQTRKMCAPKYLSPFLRKNFGGIDLVAIYDVLNVSDPNSINTVGPALVVYKNINEKPKVEPKDSSWDRNGGVVKFEASDAAHDSLKNSVKSFVDADGNDISCWIDKVEEKQVLFTKRNCQPDAANITISAAPPVSVGHALSAAKGSSGSGAGQSPLTMVVCATDPGNAQGCTSVQLAKAATVEGGVAGNPVIVVGGETTPAAETPMGYKIAGGCSLMQGENQEDAWFSYALFIGMSLMIFGLLRAFTPCVNRLRGADGDRTRDLRRDRPAF